MLPMFNKVFNKPPQIKTVINYGTVRGAIGVKQGDLIKCTTFVQGDMDCGDLTLVLVLHLEMIPQLQELFTLVQMVSM